MPDPCIPGPIIFTYIHFIYVVIWLLFQKMPTIFKYLQTLTSNSKKKTERKNLSGIVRNRIFCEILKHIWLFGKSVFFDICKKKSPGVIARVISNPLQMVAEGIIVRAWLRWQLTNKRLLLCNIRTKWTKYIVQKKIAFLGKKIL